MCPRGVDQSERFGPRLSLRERVNIYAGIFVFCVIAAPVLVSVWAAAELQRLVRRSWRETNERWRRRRREKRKQEISEEDSEQDFLRMCPKIPPRVVLTWVGIAVVGSPVLLPWLGVLLLKERWRNREQRAECKKRDGERKARKLQVQNDWGKWDEEAAYEKAEEIMDKEKEEAIKKLEKLMDTGS